MKNCKICMHWDTDNEPSEDDFYGNCKVFLGDKVFINVIGGWEGCVVGNIETESSFSCSTWEQV